jgi:NADPH:quinone reductase-like Zn-dependent oxidoreductase
VKVLAAPINPSDLHFMKGYYHDHDLFDIPFPNVPGWEGSGIVVSSGGGLMTWGWVGCRVSMVRSLDGNQMRLGGTYQ